MGVALPICTCSVASCPWLEVVWVFVLGFGLRIQASAFGEKGIKFIIPVYKQGHDDGLSHVVNPCGVYTMW